MSCDVLHPVVLQGLVGDAHVGLESQHLGAHALLDDLVQTVEGSGADEQDVLGVHLQELLLGVLAAALGRHIGHGALHDLQQSLLYALARHIAGDGGVLALAGDLVDLVDIYDAALGAGYVVVGGLDELEEDVLNILAHISGLGESGRVCYGKGHVQSLGQCLGQQGLAHAGRAEHKHVGLRELYAVVVVEHSLVVIVHRYGEGLFGGLLADDVVVQHSLDLNGLEQLVGGLVERSGYLLIIVYAVAVLQDGHTQIDASVADIHAVAGDEPAYHLLRLAAEGAVYIVIRFFSCHTSLLNIRPRRAQAASAFMIISSR